MSSTLMGSPEKSHNALKQRYLKSLQSTGLSIEPLETATSSRITSLSGSKRTISSSISNTSMKNNLFRIKQSYDSNNNNNNTNNSGSKKDTTNTPKQPLNTNSFFKATSPQKESAFAKKSALFSKTSGVYTPPETPNAMKTSPTKVSLGKPSLPKSATHLSATPMVSNVSSNKTTLDTSRSVSKMSNKFEKIDVKQYSTVELKYYEFFCRVYEAKEWIESIIDEELPSVMNIALRNELKDGVALAKVTQKINSSLVAQVHPSDTKFKYKLLENIQNFLLLVDTVDVPDTFKFETTDLYDGKNVPQVFETLHALAFTLHKKWPNKVPAMINEYGSVSFSKEDIRDCRLKFPHLKNFQFFSTDHHSFNKTKTVNHDNDLIPDFDQLDRLPSAVSETIDEEPKISGNYKNTFKTPQLTYSLENDTPTENVIEKHTPAKTRNFSVVINTPAPIELSPMKEINGFSASIPTGFEYTPKFKDIPAIDYTPRNDLSYYSSSISSNLSPRRRRRRGANLYSKEVDMLDSSLSSSGSAYSDHSAYAASSVFDQYSASQYLGSSVSDYGSSLQKKPQFDTQECSKITEKLQAICKASNIRYALYELDFKLELYEDDIIRIQSAIRSKLLLAKLGKKITAASLGHEVPALAQFQAFAKGSAIRLQYDKQRFDISRLSYTIELLQAFSKGSLVRKRVDSFRNDIHHATPFISQIQATIRGFNTRNQYGQNINTLGSNTKFVVSLQSYIRGALEREQLHSLGSVFKKSNTAMGAVLLLQSVARGNLIRKNAFKTKRMLSKCTNNNISLAACVKGALLRDTFYETLYNIECSKPAVVEMQSHLRGVLARYAIELVEEVVDDKSLVLLQTRIKGAVLRTQLRKLTAYYTKNVRAVVTLQSRIRSFAMERAYHEIMDFANPSLWAVQKFAFLLNGVQPTYETQDALDNLKESIDKENVDISKQEDNLRKIAKKIAILKDNGVVKNSLTPQVVSILNSLKGNNNIEDCETIGYYEKIFYLLQVDPFYFRLLFTVDSKMVTKYLMLLFFKRDGSLPRRETVLYIKLISEMLLVDIESRSKVEDFLLEQHEDEPWKQLLHIFLVSQQKPLLKNMFSGVIRALDSSEVSFEANPSLIYKSLYPNRAEIDPKDAIEDKATNAQYVTNMCTLWSFIEEIHQVLVDNIEKLPIEVLHLCTKAYTAVAGKSADEFDALEAISKVIIGSFVNDYLLQFESYGVKIQNPEETVYKLEILCDALSTVFSMRKFKGFYTQLNSYVESVGNEIASTLQNLQITPVYEEDMGNMVYSDMNKGNHPLLTINIKYLSEIVEFIHANIEMFPQDDPLVSLVEELQDMDMSLIFKRSLVMNLELNPCAYILCDVSDRGRPLFNNVLWGLIYILQICSIKCNSVLEVLTKPEMESEEALEIRFQNLLSEYPSIQENSIFKELPSVSYFDLKMYVTEKTLELNNMAFIDRSGEFQCLLNDIANTIKCHVYVKTRNMKEIDTAKDTLVTLKKKHKKVITEYKILKQGFDATLGDVRPVAHSNNKKKGLGSKLKEIVHSKSSKDLGSTRYKWTIKQLYEKGILRGIQGQQLENLPVNYFGSGGIKFPHIDISLSTSNGKEYIIEMADERRGHEHARYSDKFNFEAMLEHQMDSSSKDVSFFNNRAKFNSKKLLNLIIESFLS